MITRVYGQRVERWQVIFHPNCHAAVERFVPGRFKHVSLLACLEGTQVWIHYEIGLFRATVTVVPWGDTINDLLAEHFVGSTIVQFDRRDEGRPRLAFTCVSVVCHALGLKCVALTPTHLYRHLIARGGQVVWPARRAVSSSSSS